MGFGGVAFTKAIQGHPALMQIFPSIMRKRNLSLENVERDLGEQKALAKVEERSLQKLQKRLEWSSVAAGASSIRPQLAFYYLLPRTNAVSYSRSGLGIYVCRKLRVRLSIQAAKYDHSRQVLTESPGIDSGRVFESGSVAGGGLQFYWYSQAERPVSAFTFGLQVLHGAVLGDC